MARIIGVVFESDGALSGGEVAMPKAATDMLQLRPGASVEVRVTVEGGRVITASATLTDDNSVRAQPTDAASLPLADIPGGAPLTVHLFRADAGGIDAVDRPANWDDRSFDDAMEREVGSAEPAVDLRQWGKTRGLGIRYGRGSTGPMYLDLPLGDSSVAITAVATVANAEFIFRNTLDRVPAFQVREARAELVRQIEEITGRAKPASVADTWFNVPGAVLLDPTRRAKFKGVLEWVLDVAGGRSSLRSAAHEPAALRDLLVGAARQRETVTYSELAEVLGVEISGPHWAAPIGRLLERVSEDEAAAGRPMLSAIVVAKGSKLPGGGFFRLGQRLRFTAPGEDEKAFALRQIREVNDYWAAHGEKSPPTPDRPAATLHHAMEVVLREQGGGPLLPADLARIINTRRLYAQMDGGTVGGGQIQLRAKNYPERFEMTAAGIQLRQ